MYEKFLGIGNVKNIGVSIVLINTVQKEIRVQKLDNARDSQERLEEMFNSPLNCIDELEKRSICEI